MQTEGAPYRKSTGIKGSFDAVVIGSGMGGLSAASLLAQDGRRVLVLEQHAASERPGQRAAQLQWGDGYLGSQRRVSLGYRFE